MCQEYMEREWADVLHEIIDDPKIKTSIEEKGFHLFPKWEPDFRREYNIIDDDKFKKPPGFISLDFWSSSGPKQHKILRDKNLYILRIGDGKFAILDEGKFSKPYLDLNVRNTEELDFDTDDDFKDLLDAFKVLPEDPGLEHLNVTGVYNSLITKLFGDTKWNIGPRGNRVSKFKVYAQNKQNEILPLYDFDGQEELDYTIWTKDHILLFEAKTKNQNEGLDVGWHKMAYPANRFRKYTNHKIIPIYLLKWGEITHIFVFPVFDFYEDGIIINDQEKLKPDRIFRVNFGSSLDNF